MEIIEEFAAERKDEEIFIDTPEHVRLALTAAVHTSDISNPSKPLALSRQWTDRAIEEFYLQGDKERKLNIEISPLMNRLQPNVAKSQRGFIDFVVAPMLKVMAQIFPELKECIKELEYNRNYWDQQIKVEEEAAAAN